MKTGWGSAEESAACGRYTGVGSAAGRFFLQKLYQKPISFFTEMAYDKKENETYQKY
ncbi:MAG TPA: hypothetical protein IAA17_09005 [Candidatus Lachnoclostridium stercorigallinarum]|uniref:Uncharacterized protein n=1 Tax=Candidatus Lachnoclostridium stercorigallinarum TaxID=2838634 RepID=A0A9D2K5I6_9FIRM|nr:hypothetical protein [Candidatus Lachnoclostridium stercorigallinarum]